MHETFAAIYAQNAWSRGSGPGSSAEATEPYRRFLANFLMQQCGATVLDLGCGDWEFSRLMDWQGWDYLGIDVVPQIVEANQRRYGTPHIRFLVADCSRDELPPADVVLLKDVLQHWTNDEILRFLPRLQRYGQIVVTNDLGRLVGDRLESTGLNGPFAGDPAWRWRPLDLTAAPFGLAPTERWTYDVEGQWRKQVLVIEGRQLCARPVPPAAVHSSTPTAPQLVRSPAESARSSAPGGVISASEREILALVPVEARSVLHVGCGDGHLGAALKAERPRRVQGLECDQQAVAVAAECMDGALRVDAEFSRAELAPGSCDCLLLADVLARVRRPLDLLRRVRLWLSEGGCLVLRIENLRYHYRVRAILGGHWPEELILSNSIRYFTRRELEKLLYRAGFEIEVCQAHPGQADESRSRGQAADEAGGPLQFAGLSLEEAREFQAEAFLVRARLAPARQFGLTSIVLVTHNQLAYTRQCLESIRFVTDEPYELIVVDNGSTDGTPEYLRSSSDVRLIENAENRGFPAAANQGIRAAQGRQVLLLNNDTLATTGWLRRQLAALESDPRIGLVGPCSNCVSGPQEVPVTYGDLASLDGFAWEWGRRQAGQRVDTDRLVGFCLLLRREVIDQVGLLDEQFGIGNFEDDDYCLRTLQAGYRVVNARDAFVHHFGSVTFRARGIDFGGVLRANEQRFRNKWRGELTAERARIDQALPAPQPSARRQSLNEDRQTTPVALPPPTSPVEPSPQPCFGVEVACGGGLKLVRRTIGLSLCMIVRDNERTIRPCLESIRPWVDEMNIVDTGSVDRTPQIAQELGARVFHFPWCDDFATARNESLRYARGEWIFWMDSDDTISAQNGRELQKLARRPAAPNLLGYVVQVHCPGSSEDGTEGITVVDHVKLFRNLPELRFSGRIHEQILPAIRAAGGDVAWTDLYVLHSGADHTPGGLARKLNRDLHLLDLELRDHPDHPFALFNVGMTQADAGHHEAAVAALRRSLAVSDPDDSHVRKVYALLASSLSQLGRHSEAWSSCQQGRSLFPDDPELLFRQAMLEHHFGRLAEAIESYHQLLECHGPRHFASIDQGIRGHKARFNLAVVYADLGRWSDAEIQWRAVLREVPAYRAAWRGLAEALVAQRKLAQLEREGKALLREERLAATGHFLLGQAARAQGDLTEARRQLESAVAAAGDQDLGPLHSLCQLLFETSSPQESLEALEQLARQAPDDPSAHHNLGTVYLRLGQTSPAVASYKRALERRPHWPATYVQLAQAYQAAGDDVAAEKAWRRVLELEPKNAAAAQALTRTLTRTKPALSLAIR